MVTGCRTKPPATPQAEAPEGAESVELAGRPRIHSFGSSAILKFTPGEPLPITIEGQDFDANDVDISVSVETVRPLQHPRDFRVLYPGSPDGTTNLARSSQAILLITADGTSKLKSQDPFRVRMVVANKAAERAVLAHNETRGLLEQSIQLPSEAGWEERLAKRKLTAADLKVLGNRAALEGISSNRYLAAYAAMESLGAATDWASSFSAGYNSGLLVRKHPAAPSRVVKNSMVASGSRSFVLYSSDDYRSRFLAHEVEPQNITAMPLPKNECRRLFGSFVDANYYAVRLTIRNPSAEKDLLISLGLIKAYGRALVVPPDTTAGPAFTIPIEVAPQSQQQVYTMVQNGKSFKAREWIFRTLEFAGAMAAGFGGAFGASHDYLQAVSLATGAAIPGLKTLWPDQVPFHLLNIVNFAMPDLVKVPKNGSLDGKYLFFSKGQLQAVLQDPQMLGASDWLLKLKPSSAFGAQVVYLSFDTLDIPFENATSNPEEEVATRIATLKSKANAVLTSYQQLREGWLAGESGSIGELLRSNYVTLASAVTNAAHMLEKLDEKDINRVAALPDLEDAVKRLAVLDPAWITRELVDSTSLGSLPLTSALQKLGEIETSLLAGRPAALYRDSVGQLGKGIEAADEWVAYLNILARAFASPSLDASVRDHLQAGPGTGDDTAKAFTDAMTQLRKALAGLPVQPK